ncbi:MAG: peptide ligase PGM1-related protein [Actinomycetota bacterium]|nr:peptide ligase PGM1-related protein [Actinomycetota bacterium]
METDTRVATGSASFDALQRKLVPLWNSIRGFNQDEQTIVVVPSLTLSLEREGGSAVQALEERFLFLLLLLRQPRARLIYVTSQMIHPSIIDYYLDLLPGVLASHARQRLFLVAPLDGSARPLTEKLLDRPRLLERIRGLIPNPDRAHLVPYNTTEIERDLAVRLGIPMYGADPKHFWLGTKSGCRTLFAEEGVPHPLGRERISSIADLVEAIRWLRQQRPAAEKVLVKLNEGVSGSGNAMVDLVGLPSPGSPEEPAAIEERVRGMAFEAGDQTLEQYVADLEADGGVVEERIDGKEIRSPSVQLRVTPLGEVELLSTHDQLLGGPSGQSYLGCRFPADTSYAATITAEAAKIGARLAKEGVIGRFALDFLVVRDGSGGWTPYAIELNLRKGGTTHPFLTLQFLTDGTYDPERAVFTAPSGREKYFIASDHVESPQYRGLTPDDLFDLVVRRGLHFDQSRQTGVVFHMMSALPEHGRVGLTAVADSQAEAQGLYERTVAILDEETRPLH